MKGIRRRWVRNYVVIIVIISVIINFAFLAIVKNFYYNSAYHTLGNKATLSADFYSKYFKREAYTLEDVSSQLLKDFQNYTLYEVQVFNAEGSLTKTSTGFALSDFQETPDVGEALKGKTGYWNGKNVGTSEKVLSAAVPIKSLDGKVLGAIRMITSAEKVDGIIYRYFFFSMLVFMFIYVLLTALSVTFSRSILNPIYEIIAAARKMAEGKFNTRIINKYNDEFGVLASTLNYMAEEIQNSEKLKNEFISSISHEIRTPLTAIAGWGETILTGDLEDRDEVEKGLKIIIKETNRLSEMVEELLDFSRMESGRLTLYLESVPIDVEISELVEIYSRKAKQKHVELLFQESKESLFVEADKNRLRQVLINIIDNAIKFTPAGKSVNVHLESTEEHVEIIVQDEGIGIDEADLGFVTKKFFKVSNKAQGSGLGLAIANEIVNLHGGKLSIQSEKNMGTTICIRLHRVIEEC